MKHDQIQLGRIRIMLIGTHSPLGEAGGAGVISPFRVVISAPGQDPVARPLTIHAYLHARSARKLPLWPLLVNSLNCRNMAFYCILWIPAPIRFASSFHLTPMRNGFYNVIRKEMSLLWI